MFKTLTAAILSATFLVAIPAPEAQAQRAGKVLLGVGAGLAAGIIAHKVYKNRQKKKRARQYYAKPRYVVRPSYKRPVYKKRYVTKKKVYRKPVAKFSYNVRTAQTQLNRLGFSAGTPDGVMGRNTRNAIRQFQAQNGFPVTGLLTAAQVAVLGQLYAAATAPTNTLAAAPGTSPFGTQPAVTPGVAPSPFAPAPAAVAPAPGIAPASPFAPVAPAVTPVAPAPTTPAIPPVAAAPNPGNPFAPITPQPSTNQPGVSAAVYSSTADRPPVLGVKVGGTFADVSTKLAQAGFSNCETFPNAVFCERAADFGSDKIAVASHNGKIHTVTRKLSFNTPKTEAELFGPMPASYAPLIKAKDHVIAASPACSALVAAKADTFDFLVKQSMIGASFDQSSMGFSHACKYYFAINVPKGATFNEMELTFFDAEPILAGLSNVSATNNNTELKF